MNLLNILKFFKANEFGFIDIGAFRGDFTDMIITAFPRSQGLLIEPTIGNYYYLKSRFYLKETIKIINYALGLEKSEADFYCTSDSAQNSLLEFVDYNTSVVINKVSVESLDELLNSGNNFQNIDLIKIDTQGNDLNVLQGGIKTIKKYKPAILTEIIFVPLYKNQSDYYELSEFMNGLGYKLVGIYNSHAHESGCIAFSDFLFLPKEKYEEISNSISPYSKFICEDLSTILEENQILRTICEERLDLINKLSAEAQRRLDIISNLTAEIERLKGNN
jgi:FkbM family methyltransferase